jgi:hypothetical protein
MSRWNRRDRRAHKRIDPGTRTIASMPWKLATAFGQMEQIVTTIQTTGDIDAEGNTAVFQVPSSHEWYELAPAIAGFAEVYELHAHISEREMPTAPLRQLANKFKYGMMIFQSDIDLVREALAILKAETRTMNLNYVDALIQTASEAP